jgi:hypothetical protein
MAGVSAEGVDSAQSNGASLASVDTGNVFGNAQIFSSQSSDGTVDIKSLRVDRRQRFAARLGQRGRERVVWGCERAKQ